MDLCLFCRNNDGKITPDEINEVFGTFGVNIRDDLMVNLMEAFDTNKSGTLEYGEFMRVFHPAGSIYLPIH
jgi:Ca2+-binding EF-hand superfamily protein